MAVEIATILTAVVIAIATCILVAVTWYYAVQTRHTVEAMKAQTGEMRRQHEEANVASQRRAESERASARHALLAELRQLLALLRLDNAGANHTVLPAAAWRASFPYPALLPEAVMDQLFEIYGEVARLNALTELLLSMSSRERPGRVDSERSGLGLDRHTSGDFLARKVEAVIGEIAAGATGAEQQPVA